MALNGDLNDMSLTDLLEVFQLGAKSGVLYLSEGGTLGLLYVASGQAVDAVVLTWPQRITLMTSDAALNEMLRWTHAKFIFHHQRVDRPATLGRAAAQHRAENAQPNAQLQLHAQPELAPCTVQLVTAQHPEQEVVYAPRGARVPTQGASNQAQRMAASRWSLDLEPFMLSSKPPAPEQRALCPPPKHQQARTLYAAAGLARSKLIATVIQRIREL